MGKTVFAGRTIVTIVFGVFVVALSLGTWVLFFGSGLTSNFERTASSQTASVSAESLAEGATIRYSFYDRDGALHNVETWTSKQIGVMQAAKAGKPITIWYDPANPESSSVEQPRFWLKWPMILFGWGLIAVWLGIFVSLLDDFWGWGIIKKTRPESLESSVQQTLREIRRNSDPGKRRGALKGIWDSSDAPTRREICRRAGFNWNVEELVSRQFSVDGKDEEFEVLFGALGMYANLPR